MPEASVIQSAMSRRLLFCLLFCYISREVLAYTGSTRPDSDDPAHIAECMRDISMQSAAAPNSDGSVSPEEQQREIILNALRATGTNCVPVLAKLLNDRDELMRRNAVLVLGQIGAAYDGKAKIDISAAMPALIAATHDANDDVRAWSAEDLGVIGPKAKIAVPALIALLKNPDEGSRNDACIALGNIGDAARDALPELHAVAMMDRSKDARQFAAFAIQKIGLGQAVTSGS